MIARKVGIAGEFEIPGLLRIAYVQISTLDSIYNLIYRNVINTRKKQQMWKQICELNMLVPIVLHLTGNLEERFSHVI